MLGEMCLGGLQKSFSQAKKPSLHQMQHQEAFVLSPAIDRVDWFVGQDIFFAPIDDAFELP